MPLDSGEPAWSEEKKTVSRNFSFRLPDQFISLLFYDDYFRFNPPDLLIKIILAVQFLLGSDNIVLSSVAFAIPIEQPPAIRFVWSSKTSDL